MPWLFCGVRTSKMTKLQLLHRALNEHLMASLEQIMALVSGTVLEYEEETIRVRSENEALRRRLTVSTHQEPRTDLPDPSEPVTLSAPEEFIFEFGPEAPMVKQESVSDLLCIRHVTSLSTILQSTDQSSDSPVSNAEMNHEITSTFTQNYGPSDCIYMAPLEFEPTESQRNSSRRQRFSFACPVCAKVFAREHTLNVHMRIHSQTRPYAVRKHKTLFYGDLKSQWRKKHLSQTVLNTLSTRSSLCRTELLSEIDLNRGNKQRGLSETSSDKKSGKNVSTNPDVSPAPSKDVPKVTIANEATNKAHKTKGKHKNQTRFSCPVCNQECVQPYQLSRHMKTHKAEARNHRLVLKKKPRTKESAENMSVTSADPETLAASRREVKKDSTAETEKMSNQICPENRKGGRGPHNLSKKDTVPEEMNMPYTDVAVRRSIVEGKDLLMCTECGRLFASRGGLLRHMKVHGVSPVSSEGQIKPSKKFPGKKKHGKFVCSCGKKYSRRNCLGLHMRANPNCSMVTGSTRNNFAHTSQERDQFGKCRASFNCALHKKVFRSKSQARNHVQKHENQISHQKSKLSCYNLKWDNLSIPKVPRSQDNAVTMNNKESAPLEGSSEAAMNIFQVNGLQPRIVLKPILFECKKSNLVSSYQYSERHYLEEALRSALVDLDSSEVRRDNVEVFSNSRLKNSDSSS